MNSKFILCGLIGLMFSWIACAWALPADLTTLSAANHLRIQHPYFGQPFNAIDISNNVNVQIQIQPGPPTVELIGDDNSVAKAIAKVSDNVLYLGLYPIIVKQQVKTGKLLVKITMPQLNQLRYSGSGYVQGNYLQGPLTIISSGTGKIILSGQDLDLRALNASQSADIHISGIKSRTLSIQDYSDGNINLDGDIVLQSIIYQGRGALNLQWVNSSSVKVIGAGQGRIFMAGVAGLLDAELSNQTFLDAKYLHAKKGFINTRDSARADVWIQNNLNALATSGSNIFYYHDAKTVNDYMRSPGAVLRMTGLDKK